MLRIINVLTMSLLHVLLEYSVTNGLYAAFVVVMIVCFYHLVEKWLTYIISFRNTPDQKNNTIANTLMIKPLTPKHVMPTIAAICVGFSVQFILGFIFTWFNTQKPDHTDLSNLPVGTLIASVVLIAPILEEITFRGFIHRCFKSNPEIPRIWMYVIPSFIFAILHVRYPFALRLYHFILGLILVKLRETTQSLTPPIVVHASINAISLIIITSQTH